MPTYEYECKKCNKIFEVFQSITAEPIKKCPECSSPVKRRISTGGGFLFKGPGFYVTDYRSKSYKEKQKKEQESNSACPKTGEKKDCSACKVKDEK